MWFLVVYMVFNGIFARAEIFRTEVKVGGYKINEDVVIDRENNLMTVNVGSVSKIPGGCSSINLHDFGKRVFAIKNIDSGECVVARDNETLNGALESLENYSRYHKATTLSETRYLERFAMTPKETVKFGGVHVANFCEGYKTYRGKDKKGTQSRRKRARRGCWMFCGGCSIVTY